jgi:hypothetical protein
MDHIERLQAFSLFVWEGKQRGLTRREFLKRGLAMGLSLPMITAVLVGCGVEQAPAVPNTPAVSPPPPPTTRAPDPTATTAPTTTPTATATPEPTPLPAPARFAVIGDFGWAGPEEEAVANLVKSWTPDFIVTTGDNNYPSGEASTIDANIGQYYHEFMAHTGSAYGPGAAINRFFPVLGNHDTDVENGQPYFNYFILPGNERYYTVDWPPVRIYALNSVPWIESDGADPESAQAEWLRRELSAAPDAWNVVVFHHTPYSSGYRGPSPWMRWPFQEWGAHLVLSGHNHVYERIMLNGLAYITNGLGGGPRYAWGDTIAEGSVARFNANHGAILVEATPQRIALQFIAVGASEPIDSYTIEAG